MRRAGAIGVAIVIAGASGQGRTQPLMREGAEQRVDWQSMQPDLGDWSVNSDGSLAMASGERKASFALVDGRHTSFLRARLASGAKAELVLLFRAQMLNVNPTRINAYGLSVDVPRGKLSFLRWDESGIRTPGVEQINAAMRGVDNLEICVWHGGANFAAVVFEAMTKTQLGALTWSDAAYHDGDVGVWMSRKPGSSAAITLWTDKEAPRLPVRPTVAAEWLVAIDPNSPVDVPPALLSQLRPLRTGDAKLFAGNEVLVSALKESGVILALAQPGVPFAYRTFPTIAHREVVVEPAANAGLYVEGLKDNALTEEHLRAFATLYPAQTRLLTLGRSVEGRPILALRIADNPEATDRPVVVLSAAPHANEAIGSEMTLDAARYLLTETGDPRVARWLASATVLVIPVTNPDGAEVFWHVNDQLGRKNRRKLDGTSDFETGVDLYRNFPFHWGSLDAQFANDVPASSFYRGAQPASEPEVQALIDEANQDHPLACVSYHAAATRIIVPYTIEGVENPKPSAAWAVAEAMAGKLTHKFRGHRYTTVRSLYPVDGTGQDWYYNAFGTVALLVEAPFSAPTTLVQLRDVVTYSRPTWQYLLDRWLEGPSLAVRVVDKDTKAPVEAVVRLREVEFHANERWTTRKDNGWFFQYLPAAGAYTVEIEANGGKLSQSVVCAGGVCRLELEI